MGMRGSRLGSSALGLLMVVSLIGIGVAAGSGRALAAQEADLPTITARLHGGDCTNWAPDTYNHEDAPSAAATSTAGAATAIPAVSASTTVDTRFEAIDQGPHAVVVYRGTTTSPDVLACGDVGGARQGDSLLVGLREAEGSGYAGIAELSRHGIIRNQTELTVYLAPVQALLGPAPAATGAPAASPTATAPATTPATPASDVVTVELTEFRFIPPSFTIPADTPVTVTLHNVGTILHNFSIDQLRISQDVPVGETRQVTINAPAGTYQYYCDIPGHRAAGMVGTLTVQ